MGKFNDMALTTGYISAFGCCKTYRGYRTEVRKTMQASDWYYKIKIGVISSILITKQQFSKKE